MFRLFSRHNANYLMFVLSGIPKRNLSRGSLPTQQIVRRPLSYSKGVFGFSNALVEREVRGLISQMPGISLLVAHHINTFWSRLWGRQATLTECYLWTVTDALIWKEAISFPLVPDFRKARIFSEEGLFLAIVGFLKNEATTTGKILWGCDSHCLQRVLEQYFSNFKMLTNFKPQSQLGNEASDSEFQPTPRRWPVLFTTSTTIWGEKLVSAILM